MGSVLIQNILFSGCSFTWGQGLWYYSNVDEYIPNTYEYLHNVKEIPKSALDFKNKNNYAGLVSKHFNCDYEMKSWNGGTDDESIRFIENKVFKENKKYDWLILQTTQIYRSPFYSEHKGNFYNVKSEPGQHNLAEVIHLVDGGHDGRHVSTRDFDIFFDWLIDNNYSIEDWSHLFEKRIVERIETILKKCNEVGIKTAILSWTDEYLSLIGRNEYLKNQLITIEHKNRKFECISQLMDYQKNLTIVYDDENKIHKSGDGTTDNDDWHPSLNCHKIISKSVKKYLEQYENNISNRL